MIFEKLQIDPIEGANIMGVLGITAFDLKNPHVFTRLREVMDYFRGKVDTDYILKKVTLGKKIEDPLSHVWSYITLRKQYAEKSEHLETLKKEIADYDFVSDPILLSNKERKVEEYENATKDSQLLLAQLIQYE